MRAVLQSAGKHRLGARGAARRQFGSKADAPGVPSDPAIPAAAIRHAMDWAVEAAEHGRRGVRAKPWAAHVSRCVAGHGFFTGPMAGLDLSIS